MEIVNSEKKWQKVATDMGYSIHNKNIGPLLKAHYERIIYPLDIFEREEQRKNEAIKKEVRCTRFFISFFKFLCKPPLAKILW